MNVFLLSGGHLLGQPSADRNMRQTRSQCNPVALHKPPLVGQSPPHNIALSRCAVTSGSPFPGDFLPRWNIRHTF